MAKKKDRAKKGLYVPSRVELGPYIGLVLTKKEYDDELARLAPGKEFKPWVDDYGSNGRVTSLTNKDGNRVCLVSLSTEVQKDARLAMSTICHESVHVWQEHCAHIGEDEPGLETEAYGVQAIYDQLVDAFAKRVDPKLKAKWKKP